MSSPITPAPAPWQDRMILAGGLLAAGFATHPETGRDLLLIGTHNGLGLIDTVTGERLARDYGDLVGWPDKDDLTCTGIGPIAGSRVPTAGLVGGSLPDTAHGGWSMRVDGARVLLSDGTRTHQIFHATVTELRAAGFSPSGDTLIAATTSDVTLWTRSDPGEQ